MGLCNEKLGKFEPLSHQRSRLILSLTGSQYSFKVIIADAMNLSAFRARHASQGMAVSLAKKRNTALNIDKPTQRASP